MMIEQQEHYGAIVWANAALDAARKTGCLCLNCAWMKGNCAVAAHLYELCKEENLALAVTRCPHWTNKTAREE
jgi:hypothetical protein